MQQIFSNKPRITGVRTAYKVVVFTVLTFSAFGAFAQGVGDMTIGDIAQRIEDQIPGMVEVLEAAAYIGGIILGIKGILKFKENNESKGKVSLAVPIILVAASATLLALPTAINLGTETIGLDGGQSGPQLTH